VLYFVNDMRRLVVGAPHAGRIRTPRRGAGSDQTDLRHGVAWGVVGLTAQIVFTAGWVIAETWQGPRYSPVANTISDLQAATAPHVWFPIACFAVAGLGTFGFAAFGLRPALAAAGNRAWFAPWMLAFAGLALGNSFPLIPCQLSDPTCTPAYQLGSAGGLTDAIVSGTAFLVLVITPFPMWRRLTAIPRWRRLKPVMIGALITGPTCYVLLAISSSLPTMPAIGLIERLLAVGCAAWISALAIYLIRQARLVSPSPSVLGSDETLPHL
jgi:hypothetical protein